MANLRKHKQHDHDEPLEAVSMSPEMHDQDGPIWVNKFNEDSARAFVKQLAYQSMKDPTQPIMILIDSFGGEVYSLLTMVAAMEAIPNKLITVALGKAMSAGAVLLAHGDIRYVSPHTTVMIHELSAGTVGHIADLNIQHSNLAQLNDKLMKMLAKKCNIKGGAVALRKTLEKARDLYLNPEEAVKFGVADKVGIPLLQRKTGVEWGIIENIREQMAQVNKNEKLSPIKSKT